MKIYALNDKILFYNLLSEHGNIGTVYKVNNTFLKLLRRIHVKLNLPGYGIWLSREFKKSVDEQEIILFDSLLNIPAANYIKRKYPSLRVIYYFWNHINNPEELKLLSPGIEIWSYDKEDCKKYGLNYNTQFYFSALGDYRQTDYEIKWDFYFVGADKGRKKELEELETVLSQDFSCNFHITQDLAKKNTFIPYCQVVDDMRASRCIIDVLPSVQTGMSIRPLEAICLKKKLLTNFKGIRDFEFYHPDNVFIIGEDDFDNLKTFMDRPFVPVDFSYFDFQNWLQRFKNNNK